MLSLTSLMYESSSDTWWWKINSERSERDQNKESKDKITQTRRAISWTFHLTVQNVWNKLHLFYTQCKCFRALNPGIWNCWGVCRCIENVAREDERGRGLNSRWCLTSFSEEEEDKRYSWASKNSDMDSGIDALLSLDAWWTKEWELPGQSW